MRSAAPLILKMSFKTPDAVNKSKNIGHLNYIAKREGVERNSGIEPELDIREDFEKTVDELLTSMEKEAWDEKEEGSGNDTYSRYINERPGSHGLFGENGPEEISTVQKQLKDHDGIVWRGVISLHGGDAERLGYTNQKKWNEMMNANMKDMANKMGLKETGIQWAGAYHHEKGHPHVHFMLWEKEPSKTRGVVSEYTIDSIKRDLVKEVFREDRLALQQEKTAMRDLMRELATENIAEQTKILRELNDIARQQRYEQEADGTTERDAFTKPIYKEDQDQLVSEMKELSSLMRGKGRIAYEYQTSDIKNKAAAIAKNIMSKPQFSEYLHRYTMSVEGMVKHYTNDQAEIQKATDNAMRDLQKRISQIILKGANESEKRSFFTFNQENADTILKNLKEAEGVPPVELQKKVLTNFAKTIFLAGAKKEEVLHELESWNVRSGANVPNDELTKYFNAAHKSHSEQVLWDRLEPISKTDFKELKQALAINDDTPYLFQSKNGFEISTFAPSMAQSIWKEVSKELEKEMSRQEAEAEMRRRMMDQKTVKRSKQESRQLG